MNTPLTYLAMRLMLVAIVMTAFPLSGCGKKNQEASPSGTGNSDPSADSGKGKVASTDPKKSDEPVSSETDVAKAIEKSSAWGTRKAAAVRLRRQSLEALDRAKTDRDRQAEASRYASAFEFQNATAEEWQMKPLRDALYADAVTELGRDWVRYIDKNTPDPTLTLSQRALIESWSDDGIRGSLLGVLFFAYEASNQVDYPRLTAATFIRERFWSKLFPMAQEFLLERVWKEMKPIPVVYGRWGRKYTRFKMDLRPFELATLQDWTSRLSVVIQSHDWLLKRYPGYAPVKSEILNSWGLLEFVEGSFNSPGSNPEAKERALTLQLFRDQISVIAQGDSAH